ncbi:Trk system potassium uptake protein TrkA [subsurface metagenome]
MGIDYLFYPEMIAAREVIGLLHQTGTTEFLDFSGGRLSLFVLKLDENAPIINKTLMEVTKQNKPLDYRAVAITRNGKTIIPHGDDRFLVNDLVYVVSTLSGYGEIMKYAGKEKLTLKNIMILGGSRIGRRIAKELERQYNIKLIDTAGLRKRSKIRGNIEFYSLVRVEKAIKKSTEACLCLPYFVSI